METKKEVTVADFARAFGTTAEEIEAHCGELIKAKNFKYRVLERSERDTLILEILKKIDSDTQVIGAPKRTETWEKGWAENLRAFIENKQDKALTPKFIRLNQPIRLDRQYILPEAQNFELDFFEVLRLWLFKKYLRSFDIVYDFGCGTGFNLKALAELYPEKELHGLDFVPSSRDLVNEVAKTYHLNLEGHLFDMRAPDRKLRLKKNSAVMHFGAVEQLASDIEPFFKYLMENKPALCVALEPTVELYDENNLIDYLAMKFHRKRGYTEGYLPKLKQLEAEKKIEILKIKRTYFGSLFMEGFSFMIWRLIV